MTNGNYFNQKTHYEFGLKLSNGVIFNESPDSFWTENSNLNTFSNPGAIIFVNDSQSTIVLSSTYTNISVSMD